MQTMRTEVNEYSSNELNPPTLSSETGGVGTKREAIMSRSQLWRGTASKRRRTSFAAALHSPAALEGPRRLGVRRQSVSVDGAFTFFRNAPAVPPLQSQPGAVPFSIGLRLRRRRPANCAD
jgi:hypothetical protein